MQLTGVGNIAIKLAISIPDGTLLEARKHSTNPFVHGLEIRILRELMILR